MPKFKVVVQALGWFEREVEVEAQDASEARVMAENSRGSWKSAEYHRGPMAKTPQLLT